MLANNVSHETHELDALRIDASLSVLKDFGLCPRGIACRYLRSQPADDAAADVQDESIRVTTGAQREGAKSLVACSQRFERLGRRLGAGEVVVPMVFPTRVSARSMLRE
jgi:hypothetical protein